MKLKSILLALPILFFALVVPCQKFVSIGYTDEIGQKSKSPNASAPEPRDLFKEPDFKSLFKKLNEPSLIEKAKDKAFKDQTIYRFTWLRSFHRPICITVVEAGEKITITYTILERKRKDAKLEEEKTIEIDKKGYKAFLVGLEEADYFKMGPDEAVEQIWNWDDEEKKWWIWGGSTKDGADWILEYCAEGRYYINNRRNTGSTSFGKACIQLIQLAGLEKEKIY